MKVFHGVVKSGKFRAYEEWELKEAVCALEGQKATISIGKYRKPRSNQQNAYYWTVIVDKMFHYLEEQYSPEEVHEILKFKFLRIRGEQDFVRSTRTLDSAEWEEYMENIRRWASTLEPSLYIPNPNEQE